MDCGRFWRFSTNFNLLDLSWISFNCTPHSSHRLLNPVIFDIPKFSSFIAYEMDEVWGTYAYIAINNILLTWESHHWVRSAFQFISKLGVPLLGQVWYLQLLPRWEVPAGTELFMQLLARFWFSVAWVTIFCNQVRCLAALITIA